LKYTLEKVFCDYFGLEVGKQEFFHQNREKASQKIDFSAILNKIYG